MLGIAIWGTGMVIILAISLIWSLRTSEGRVTTTLQTVGSQVPVPLTPEIEAWLRPQMDRRDRWIGGATLVGSILGSTTAFFELPLPWYWLITVLLASVGYVVGTLFAAFSNFPSPEGSERTASLQPRRLRDLLKPRDRVLLALALPMAVLALGASITVFEHHADRLGLLGLGLCVSSAAVVIVLLALARFLVSRPMVSRTPEARLWQEAMLAATVRPMPGQAVVVAALSGAAATVGMAHVWDQLPGVSRVVGVVLLAPCLACTIGAVVALVAEEWNETAKAQELSGQRRW